MSTAGTTPAAVTVAFARVGDYELAVDATRIVGVEDGWPDEGDFARLPRPWDEDARTPQDGRTLALTGPEGKMYLLPVESVVLVPTDLSTLHPTPSFLVPWMERLSVMGLVRRPEGLAFLLDVDRLCARSPEHAGTSR